MGRGRVKEQRRLGDHLLASQGRDMKGKEGDTRWPVTLQIAICMQPYACYAYCIAHLKGGNMGLPWGVGSQTRDGLFVVIITNLKE